MLRALGGFGFEPAAFLLFGEIGLRDGYRARDEQNQRQRQREKANRAYGRPSNGDRARARAADAAGIILRFNRHDANGAARYGQACFRQSVVGEMRSVCGGRLRRTGAAETAAIQQRIDLLRCVCSIVPSVSMTAFARRIFSSSGI